MIVSLGEDVKPSALSATPLNTQVVGDLKEPTHYLKRVRDLFPVIYLGHFTFNLKWTDSDQPS